MEGLGDGKEDRKKGRVWLRVPKVEYKDVEIGERRKKGRMRRIG